MRVTIQKKSCLKKMNRTFWFQIHCQYYWFLFYLILTKTDANLYLYIEIYIFFYVINFLYRFQVICNNIYLFLYTNFMFSQKRKTKQKNNVLKWMEHFGSRTIVSTIIFFLPCLNKYRYIFVFIYTKLYTLIYNI